MNAKINKVLIRGDIVEVEATVDGILKNVRRHVQNYSTLTTDEKQKLWFEIAEVPYVEYTRARSLKDKISGFFKHKD